MGILDKLKAKKAERRKLKALENAAYIGEKKKVDAAKRAKAAEQAVLRGQARARGKANKGGDIKQKFDKWADRKAAEMKKEQGKEGPFKIPPGYKW